MTKCKKIIFLVTEDWYFLSHRLPIALAAKESGHEVVVLTRINTHKFNIEKYGFTVIPLKIKRESRNLFLELEAIFQIIKIYLKEKPDLTHHVAVKPILYGSVAAMVTRVPHFVNAIPGLGFAFSRKKGIIAGVMQFVFLMAYGLIFRWPGARAIFQNSEDKALFEDSKIVKKNQSILIRGSGVDVDQYQYLPEPPGIVTILFGARMLWDKGVKELVQAVKLLKKKDAAFRVVLAGMPDPANPQSIPVQVLENWHNSGLVTWVGFQKDMPALITRAHIITLPSYREGVPKFLLEAASCGRPIVTTNVPGCREIVKQGENGILVPPKDPQALAHGLYRLIKDGKLRKKMGKKGREMVVQDFSEKNIVNKTMEFYKRIWMRVSEK